MLIADNFANIEYSGNSEREKVIDSIELTKCLKNGINLLQHQKEGVQWLLNCYANYKGALLADDMGLGKTLQTLAFAAVTKKYLPESFTKSILIVAPVSLLMNWKEEYEKFVAPGLFKEVVVIGSNNVNYFHRNGTFDFSAVSEERIVLTSYETLRTYQFSLGKIDWSLMVLDEAQRIKNPTALITLAIKAMKYDFGLCLTGTPIENTWIDLWSIMDFAAPGYNLGSLSEFKKNYVNKLKKHSKDEAYIKQLGQSLNNELKPLFKRRLKKTLSEKGGLQELPKKKIIKRKEIMPLTQRLAYENIVNEALGNSVDKKTALEVIAKLRDISLFPDIGTIDERSLSHKDAVRIFNSSARLKVAFTELVNIAAKDEKVLIFIESKKMQRILRSVIETFFKIKVPTPINGDMRSEIRQAIVDNFNLHEGFGVLILSPLAAGVGLNIATANHVIHLSRHWNPAKEDQATDRAYRIGQKKDVEVVIPMAVHPTLKEGSFDSMLDTLLDYKRQLSEDALFPTADSADDGLNIFRKIAKGGSGATTITKEYYDIDSVDGVDGITFEKITANLYNNIGMLANKTTDSNDNGADVVAFSGS
ncbi:MAG: DEAD/DEAH box helicase family protein, partial [Lachnospiraceae bacterium]|nr:DEAD/DEAH box helicase family protein [Lachnospiraceae bacterium]